MSALVVKLHQTEEKSVPATLSHAQDGVDNMYNTFKEFFSRSKIHNMFSNPV